MSVYLLDSDILTLFVEGHSAVCARVLACESRELTTSIVCVEESITGWYSLLRKTTKDDRIVWAYQKMTETVELLRAFRVLTFDTAAAKRFRDLRAARVRIGMMDLRIGSTALEAGAILVTRNIRDFACIPGLTIEDWTHD